jgi:hypothetical protein
MVPPAGLFTEEYLYSNRPLPIPAEFDRWFPIHCQTRKTTRLCAVIGAAHAAEKRLIQFMQARPGKSAYS